MNFSFRNLMKPIKNVLDYTIFIRNDVLFQKFDVKRYLNSANIKIDELKFNLNFFYPLIAEVIFQIK